MEISLYDSCEDTFLVRLGFSFAIEISFGDWAFSGVFFGDGSIVISFIEFGDGAILYVI